MPPSLDSTFGAMFIGLLFATFFQGILSVQAFIYYENFPNDPFRTKALVGSLWCIDLLHLVLISKATYHYLVTNWGNPPALMFSVWTLDTHLVILGVATVMCQSFFLHRIWLFSNKNVLLIVAVAACSLATFGLDVFMSVKILIETSFTEFQALTPEVTAVFSIGAGTDVMIAVLLCYYLMRGRSGFEKTNSLIAHLVRYTITTGLATSMLAVGCLVAYFASPNSLVFVAMHFSLGRMYTNALLATLNSRRSLRAVADQGSYNQRTPEVKQGGTMATFGFGSGSRNAGPVGAFKSGNGMAIQVETNTTSVVDTSQAFSPEYTFKSARDHHADIELEFVGDNYKAPFEP